MAETTLASYPQLRRYRLMCVRPPFFLPPTKSFCPYKIIPVSEGGVTNVRACNSGGLARVLARHLDRGQRANQSRDALPSVSPPTSI